MSKQTFPEKFLWGVATSAQQIEGAFQVGGRGESIWDRYASIPGNIEDGSNPRVACDHYHRWKEDVGHLKWLGVNAYRFSIAWPRILPHGRGARSFTGLDFYDELVDELLRNGIRPLVTLNHWDLPQDLQDEGGWAQRSVADAFVEYAHIVSERLGDRVTDWVTHNEPWCIATLGHEEGKHAPGHHDAAESLLVAHHLLLSHGWATRAIRCNSVNAQIGIVLNLMPVTAASDSPRDQDAARQLDGTFNRWFLEPLYHGHYPHDVIEDRCRLGHLQEPALPFVETGDMRAIFTSTDFLGVNYYSRAVVKADKQGRPVAVATVPEEELTDMGWEVFPSGLHDLLVRLQNDYHPPRIYITENGVAYDDGPDANGRIEDTRRIHFIQRHLLEVLRARQAGVPVEGYFLWSLLDNFEWGHGYTKRFGLFWVDYESLQRTPKQSAFWYRDTITANAVDTTPDLVARRIP